MRSFAIVIRRAYFEAKKRRKYAKSVVVNRSAMDTPEENAAQFQLDHTHRTVFPPVQVCVYNH